MPSTCPPNQPVHLPPLPSRNASLPNNCSGPSLAAARALAVSLSPCISSMLPAACFRSSRLQPRACGQSPLGCAQRHCLLRLVMLLKGYPLFPIFARLGQRMSAFQATMNECPSLPLLLLTLLVMALPEPCLGAQAYAALRRPFCVNDLDMQVTQQV